MAASSTSTSTSTATFTTIHHSSSTEGDAEVVLTNIKPAALNTDVSAIWKRFVNRLENITTEILQKFDA